MKIAIQETLLPGDRVDQRVRRAAELGVDGIEFQAAGMGARILDVAAALDQHGMVVSALNVGGTHLLHPEFDYRNRAIAAIGQAMTDSLDLGSGNVVFQPYRADTPPLPDLRPYKHTLQMYGEFLATQLRSTLCDLAYAVGATLHLAPVNRYENDLLNTLEQADTILRKNEDHEHLKIAANTFHMTLEEADPYEALQTYAPKLGTVHLADHNGGLPGEGWIDFKRVISALKTGGYTGEWVTICTRHSEPTEQQQRAYLRGLPACIDMLRAALSH